VLPEDKEALRYLTDYARGLNIISGNNCLVLALSKSEFKSTGFIEGDWRKLVKEHSNQGHSAIVARLFNIDFTRFPCLLIFQDIHSSEHMVFDLKEMAAEEISENMRLVFSVIQKAVRDGKAPLDELEGDSSINNYSSIRGLDSKNEEASNTFIAAFVSTLKSDPAVLKNITINIDDRDVITIRDIIKSTGIAVGDEAEVEVYRDSGGDS
jgi:hypothetical protein